MFDISVKADVLKELIAAIDILVDEAKFNISKSEIVIRAVDPAHVAMINLTLSKKAFEEFKADECELGIDLDKIKEIIKLAKGDDLIHLKHDEEKNRLVLSFGNLTRRMSLVDIAGMSDPKVPNLEFAASAVVSTAELRQAVRASENVSDHITITCSPEGFEVSSKGETDSVDLKLHKDMLDKLDCKDVVTSMFPLDYFSHMIQAVSAPSISVNMSAQYPVKIYFDLAGGKGKGEYLLAPRIENE